MPKHELAGSAYPEGPRLNRTRDEMIADFKEQMEERRADPARYYAGDNATPEEIEAVRAAGLKVPPKGKSRRKRR